MRTGIRHTGTRLYVDDVRKELYRVRNAIARRRDHHIAAFGDEHRTPCRVCMQFHSEIEGVREAIRHFGGTAHWIPRPEGW
jgi:hypothetical protein